MAKRNTEFSMEIEEFIDVIKDNEKHDWCKAVARISWNENPATLDIRTMNMAQKRAGKGISLTDEEADRLVEILLDNDYGTIDALTKAINKKKSRFTITEDTHFEDDKPLILKFD